MTILRIPIKSESISLSLITNSLTFWTNIGTTYQSQPSYYSSSVGDRTATSSSCSKSLDLIHSHVPLATVSGECGVQLLPTSAPEERETSKDYSTAVIGVSSVSLLVIVILITVILTQCLLILRMRKSKDVLHSNETYAEHHVDVTAAPNEAYALHKLVKPSEEDTYEMVK